MPLELEGQDGVRLSWPLALDPRSCAIYETIMTRGDHVQTTGEAAPNLGGGDGILPADALRALINGGVITASEAVTPAQIQPASLDLRLGEKAYRVRASFLPGSVATVGEKIDALALHEIDLSQGAVLETGCVYLVPLQESLLLPENISGLANPKSSTGRIDVFTRLITDRAIAFDRVEAGYQGPLYAEISPRTFSVLVRAGSSLNQIRFRRGASTSSDAELRDLQDERRLIESHDDTVDINQGISLSVDLTGRMQAGLVGYRAKRHAGLIDVDKAGILDPKEFWEPVIAEKTRSIILDPDEFYILASKEAVHVPPDFAAEMMPFNPLVGEFRVHYAGFFDPGFGHDKAGGQGSRAVLEVRSHEVPFILTDGQIIGRLIYERLTETPETVYGQGIGSNYQRQGLKLSKHFKEWR